MYLQKGFGDFIGINTTVKQSTVPAALGHLDTLNHDQLLSATVVEIHPIWQTMGALNQMKALHKLAHACTTI